VRHHAQQVGDVAVPVKQGGHGQAGGDRGPVLPALAGGCRVAHAGRGGVGA
jgi:hypothetical protein